MSVAELANRYAEAFCGIAHSNGKLDEAVSSLESLSEALEPAREIIFANPEVTDEERHEVLDKVFQSVEGDEEVVSLIERFCRLLVDKDRIRFLSAITQACRDEADQIQNRKRASVRTAYKLDDQRKQALKRQLSQRFDADVLLEEEMDPDLIAGLQIQIEDYLMDHTVRKQIEDFYEKFSRN